MVGEQGYLLFPIMKFDYTKVVTSLIPRRSSEKYKQCQLTLQEKEGPACVDAG